MRPGRTAHCLFVCLLSCVVLGGCASREVLVPKSGAVPAGVDLSGTWRMRDDTRGSQRRIDEAIRRTDGVSDEDIFLPPDLPTDRNGVSRSRRNTGGLVHVFLENGTTLKITQTGGALFLSFDRAVVVEFRFGENREVQVGPVIADRVSGWEGQAYVAETLGPNSMKLTERFVLVNPHTLQRTIVFRSKSEDEETIVQTFDRIG